MPMRLSSYLVGKTRSATNTFFYNVLSVWSLLEHLATLTVTTYYIMDIVEGVSFFSLERSQMEMSLLRDFILCGLPTSM